MGENQVYASIRRLNDPSDPRHSRLGGARVLVRKLSGSTLPNPLDHPSSPLDGHVPAVGPMLAYARQHRDPAGKVVVYGFSAGGYNALEFCRRFHETVDLLVVVDAAASNRTILAAGAGAAGPLMVEIGRAHV